MAIGQNAFPVCLRWAKGPATSAAPLAKAPEGRLAPRGHRRSRFGVRIGGARTRGDRRFRRDAPAPRSSSAAPGAPLAATPEGRGARADELSCDGARSTRASACVWPDGESGLRQAGGTERRTP